MRRHTILLIGSTGQVGWELKRALATVGEVVAVGRGSRPLAVDLADPDSLRAAVEGVGPSLIVNAAAHTAVDRAEEEVELSTALNATAPAILAEEAKRRGAGFVHYSTDYVFDGTADTPYTEGDPPNPQGVYGRTKLAGEEAVRAVGGDHLILRTAWVYGMRGHNFLRTMLRLGGERESLGIVGDQFGAPTWSRVIAEATAQMLVQPGALSERGGLYHLTCGGETSWHGFASAIFERAGAGLKVREVNRIATADYPTPARRPAYSVLSNQRLAEHFGIHPPHWTRALDLCMERDGAGETI